MAKLFALHEPVIQNDKPSLSVCAFGAGAAHAALLALVLPVMITLPAPKDEARGTVAIQVAVRTVASTPFIQAAMTGAAGLPQAALEGEGDIDEGAWTVLEAKAPCRRCRSKQQGRSPPRWLSRPSVGAGRGCDWRPAGDAGTGGGSGACSAG